MPGLKQAGNIANDSLCTHFKKYRYAPVQHTPAIWKHELKNITFTLVVDEFGIKFTRRRDAENLAIAREDLYVITKDWEGNVF